VELIAKRHGQFGGLPSFVEGNCFPDVIDNDLARVAACHMPLKFVAKGGVQGPIDVFIQQLQQLLAFHKQLSWFIEPWAGGKLQAF
jgi:hypothetical protein